MKGPLSFFADIGKEGEKEAIKEVCLGETLFTTLFQEIIPKETLSKVFNELNSSLPPQFYKPIITSPNLHTYYCDVMQILKIIGENPSPNSFLDMQEVYLTYLRNKNEHWAENLLNALKNINNIPEKQHKTIIKDLGIFFNTNKALFTALHPTVEKIFSVLNNGECNQAFGVQIYQMREKVDPKFIVTFPNDQINPQNIGTLWGSRTVLMDDTVSQLYQKLFVAQCSFPKSFSVLNQSNIVSLGNDSVTKRKHFVDIILSYAHNFLMTRDFPKVAEVLEIFDDLRPWALLMDYEKLIPDLKFFKDILSFYEKSDFCLNFFGRFRNDEKLLNFLSNVTGNYIKQDDVVNKSLPVILKDAISGMSTDDLADLKGTELLTIPDKDVQQDAYFIVAFRAMELVVNSFDGGDFDEDEFDSLLQIISDAEERNKLAVDIFSLIFQKDSEGNYLCSVKNAQKILICLDTFTENSEFKPYLTSALNKIQRGDLMNVESISDCLLSTMDAVIHAFKAHEYDLAEMVSISDPKLNRICELAHSISLKRNGNESQIPANVLTPLFFAEYAASTNQETEKVDDSVPHIKAILEKRANEEKEDNIKAVIAAANEHFEGSKTPFEYKEDKLLYSFVERMDTFNKNISRSGRSGAKGLILSIIESPDIESVESLKVLLGENAVEQILHSKYLKQASSSMRRVIDSISPLIFKSLDIETKINKTVNDIKNKQKPLFASIFKKDSSVEWIFDTDTDKGAAEFVSLFLNSLKHVSLNEEELFNVLDLIDTLLNGEVNETFASKIIQLALDSTNVSTFFLTEARLRWGNVVNEFTELISAKLPLEDFVTIFPEKSSQFVEKAISCGITTCNFFTAVDELIEKSKIMIAMQLAKEQGIEDYFMDQYTNYLTKKIRKGEDLQNVLITEDKVKEIIGKMPEDIRQIAERKLLPQNKSQSEEKAKESSTAFPDVEKLLEETTDYTRLYNKYAKSGENINELNEIFRSSLSRKISNLSVNSLKEEMQAITTIIHCQIFLEKTKIPHDNERFAFLAAFAKKMLFARFGVSYSFSNFETNIINYPKILAQYDEFRLVERHKGMWEERVLCEARLKECINCFTIGLFDEGVELLEKCNRIESTIEKLSPMVKKAKIDLQHPILSELRIFKQPIHVEYTPPYYRISCIIMGRGGALINRAQYAALEKLVIKFSSVKDILFFYSSIGQWKELFKVWKKAPADVKTVDCVIENIITPAINTQQIHMLWQHLKRNQDDLISFEVLDDIVEHFKENNILLTLADMQINLGYYEDSIFTLLDAVKDHSNWNEWASKLEMLKLAISKEKLTRNDGRRALKISPSRFSRIEMLTGLQKQYVDMCIKAKIRYNKHNDLMFSDSSAEQMALFCFFNQEFTLGVKIADTQDALQSVSQQLFNKIKLSGSEMMKVVFQQMAEKMDADDYTRLVTYLITNLSETVKRSSMPLYITNNVKGIDLQVKLLANMNFFTEALSIAKRFSSKQAYLIIENAASVMGNTKVVKECEKMLRKL